ncbi:Flagellar basal-body rod protein FlgG [Caloramator mitchellensis]|uniref:Flagellar basal-body rod protein FlgG n=1 Tax=Caloramator mitchellensis TaxID=908809 RepID=A0A0R3K1B5_CALMK|nr:flagellar hook-basal body complex protein [Caloramator mitchellensis]KRQ87036.1 Flagellar basal-body rod protein FlgG [Caloramator mitchellensis]
MLKVMWNGRSGLYSSQNRIDVISNNIANIDTNGYKRLDVAFSDIFNESLDRLGTPITNNDKSNLTVGSGVRGEELIRNFSQGLIKETGNKTDVAIVGEGYFKVKDGDGNYFYTRDGAFNIDANGNFVHSSGLFLEIENYNNNLSINDNFIIKSNGDVYNLVDGSEELVGKINVYEIIGQDSLKQKGENLFAADNANIKESTNLKQGYLEKSNVDIAKELTDMLVTQRAFELNSRTVKTADDMWQIANNIRGK